MLRVKHFMIPYLKQPKETKHIKDTFKRKYHYNIITASFKVQLNKKISGTVSTHTGVFTSFA